MKSILGFGIEDVTDTIEAVPAAKTELDPVRSLVSVRFINDGRAFTYFNDRFDLSAGDRVFVSGKLAGKPGIVEKVTTRFRINLSDYQCVISKACDEIHGTYESVIDKMVSYDHAAMTAAEFRSWILPPKPSGNGDEGEILTGDGYELNLPSLEEDDDVDHTVLERAVEYCRTGKVAYISVTGGVGKAFIEGKNWYEVDFRLHGDMITEMYCDCMYPGLCKHLLAVAITIRAMSKNGGLDTERDFVVIDDNRFWSMAASTVKQVTL